jgi:histidine triad (HIT) family protein
MPACVFCAIAAGEAAAHVVLDEADVFAFLDARPVFPGHTLVVPRSHIDTMLDLDDDALAVLFGAARRVSAAVETVLGAGGSWVSVNNRVSQSVPHVHVHVVPRTKGDGLRGFFWPRHRYASDEEAAAIAAKLRDGLA